WAVPIASPDGPFPPQTQVKGTLSSNDYTLGVRISPVQSLTLRASLGTGFLPPSLSLLEKNQKDVDALTNFPSSETDPRRGGERLIGNPQSTPAGVIIVTDGGNQNLGPEQSKSFSYGVIFKPRFLDGLRLSLDVTHINKSDEISTQDDLFFINNEALFPDRI